MGRKKNTVLAAKPLNVRLYEESQREIKEIAEREGVFDSDVHRELVAEALQARRERADGVAAEPPAGGVVEALGRVEIVLSELAGSGMLSLREEVQTLTSRVAYLSDQIALLTSPPKRHKPRDKQEEMLFS
jgi:polyhydroxyalkanoate synthesis regulator phasin